MVVALADSFFFDVDPSGARSKVLAFLLVSFAPFLVVAPFIGPVIDRVRGGRRFVVQAVAVARFVVQLLMIRFSGDTVLFGLVFVALVLSKTYQVSKSALVPAVVRIDRELVARIRALLRRANGDTTGEVERSAATSTLRVGDVTLDPEAHRLTVRGQEVTVPLKEFEVLHLLLANAGRVLTREVLIDRVWGSDYVGDTKTLDVHIKRLRSKIEVDPSAPTRIVTIRGLGYKYERVPAQLV